MKPTTLPTRLLSLLARTVYHYPRLVFYPQVLLFVFCIFYTVENLQFSTNRNDLVGADKHYHRNFLEFKKEFVGQDDLVAIVESEQPEKNRQFVERLGARLEMETNLFTSVFYKGDLKLMGPKALLFLDNQTLHELQKTLTDYRPFIQNFARTTNFNSLFRLVNQQFRTAKREQNESNESLVKALPALEGIVTQAADSLLRPGMPPSPGLSALFGGTEQSEQGQYITFATNRLYLVTARARSEHLNADAVHKLRELARLTQAEVPGVNVGITGEPVLEADEMAQSQRDTTVATVWSLVLVAWIFIYGFKETGRPIKATICLIVGLAYTLAFATAAIGHLNILTITFVPMLVGLAIDFGVHLSARYEEELRKGHTEWEAIEKAMVFTGLGIFTGCLTTAGAFLAMGITDFRGIKEMGIICGGGLIICLVPMMTMLPVLLLRGQQNILDHTYDQELDRRARVEKLWLERPVAVLVATAALTIASVMQFDKIYFDYNLLNLQSKGLPAVEFERKLIKSTPKSVIYAAVVTDSLENAVALEDRIKQLPSVISVDSMARFLSEDPKEKLRLIGEIKRQVAAMFSWPGATTAPVFGSILLGELDEDPVDVKALSQTLTFLTGYLGLASTEVQKEGNLALYKELRSLRQAVVTLQQRMLAGDAVQVGEKLGAFQRALFSDIRDTFAAIRNQDDSAPLRPADLPPALRDRFIGVTGKYLLQVYPRKDVWERGPQEEFIRELRTVDPDVTGTPIQLYEYTTLLKDSYIEAAWYSLAAIALLVLFHFRSLVCVMLALGPVLLGMIWMVGWMGWQDLPFNPANIMTLPLAIGIGVTSGIHILNRFMEEENPGILARSTGLAVIVSALTTVAGFGSLVIGKHQGIASLGMVMAVGTGTCMLAAITFLPALMKLMIRMGWKIKQPSDEHARSALGREEPR